MNSKNPQEVIIICPHWGNALVTYNLETAYRYRSHAAKLRLLASRYDDVGTAEILVGVARDYELMAEVYEKTAELLPSPALTA